MKDVKYVKETGEYLVGNSVVNEKTLTESEKKKLKKKCKNVSLITGNVITEGEVILG